MKTSVPVLEVMDALIAVQETFLLLLLVLHVCSCFGMFMHCSDYLFIFVFTQTCNVYSFHGLWHVCWV